MGRPSIREWRANAAGLVEWRRLQKRRGRGQNRQGYLQECFHSLSFEDQGASTLLIQHLRDSGLKLNGPTPFRVNIVKSQHDSTHSPSCCASLPHPVNGESRLPIRKAVEFNMLPEIA